MNAILRNVGMQFAAVEGRGDGYHLAAKDYKDTEHASLQCLCPDCLLRGKNVRVHYVRPSERSIPFLRLDAQSHEELGSSLQHYKLGARFVTSPGQKHLCDLPMRQALRDLAYKTNALPTNQADIYSFNMRVPYEDNYYGRSYEFLDGPFAQERLQSLNGAKRTFPQKSGLRTAGDLTRFFTDKSYARDLMEKQRLWDGQRLRKAGDFLLEGMRDVVEAAYDPPLPLSPYGVVFQPIADGRVRADYARKFIRDDDAPWIIPGLAKQVDHDGVRLRPSVVLEFTSQALRGEASKIINRRKTCTRKVAKSLIVGQVEVHKERFNTVAAQIRSGQRRDDGLKVGLGIYMRIHDIVQVSAWDEPDTQMDMFAELARS